MLPSGRPPTVSFNRTMAVRHSKSESRLFAAVACRSQAMYYKISSIGTGALCKQVGAVGADQPSESDPGPLDLGLPSFLEFFSLLSQMRAFRLLL